MVKSITPSFITTIPLVVTSQAESELLYQQSANRVNLFESRRCHSPSEPIRSDKEKSSQIASERMGDKLDQGS